MLYDQAMISMACLEAFQFTKNEKYATMAREIFTYVLRDMTDKDGGFYSAEDADSEGIEGKFYVWNINEIRKILNEKDAQLFITTYNLTEDGNFSEEASKSKSGNNIPHLKMRIPEVAKRIKLEESELELRLTNIRKTLFEVREKRVHPYKDDKILTDWNGLMIAALAKAARVLDDKEIENAAIKSTEFVITKMQISNNKLLHRYRDGDAAIQATIDDYSFMIWGLIELYETTFNLKYLQKALELQKVQNKYFWDEQNGGYFFTSSDAEKLLTRSKEIYDGAIPSGNSVSLNNLIKLGRLTANSNFEKLASELSKVFSTSASRSPSGSSMLLQVVNFAISGSSEVIIVGDENSKTTKEIIKKLNKEFIPNKVIIVKNKKNKNEIEAISPFTKDYEINSEETLVYVCKNYQCNLPTNNIKTILELLNK
jgi:uncharacterized protein YyaL (SSP411 family)